MQVADLQIRIEETYDDAFQILFPYAEFGVCPQNSFGNNSRQHGVDGAPFLNVYRRQQ